jgi:hypothetical protein
MWLGSLTKEQRQHYVSSPAEQAVYSIHWNGDTPIMVRAVGFALRCLLPDSSQEAPDTISLCDFPLQVELTTALDGGSPMQCNFSKDLCSFG